MMILKRLACQLFLLFCSISLVGCGTSNSSNSNNSDVNLNISWEDNSNNESGFRIDRRIQSNVDSVPIDYTDANTTSYNDEDVLTGETYCYRISAFNELGSSPSDEVCIEV